jgi:hypothetical protein
MILIDKISSNEMYLANMKMDGKASHGALNIEVLLKKWFPIAKELELLITKTNVIEENDDERGEIEITTRQILISIITNLMRIGVLNKPNFPFRSKLKKRRKFNGK